METAQKLTVGSVSSDEAPNETQSGPSTASATQKQTEINLKFEKVQIADQVGGRCKPHVNSTGASPNTKQSTLSKNTGFTNSETSGGNSKNLKQRKTHLQGTAAIEIQKDNDIVFETFYHRSGKEFQCIYQSGMRFYLEDSGSKEWQPFPKRWYNEGLLVTNTILKDENAQQNDGNEQAPGASDQGQSSRSQGQSQGQRSGGGGGGGSDDREGLLMHPTKGRIPTYIFYKKHNVHMYHDRDTGSWVRMPIGWELHHDMVKSLVDQVEEAVPTWGDRHDMLSLLRACNYDPDRCISIYKHLEKDQWMKGPKTTKENKVLMEKEAKLLEAEKRIKHLELQLQKEKDARQDSDRNRELQMKNLSELEGKFKETEAQLSAVLVAAKQLKDPSLKK